jgi:2-polyprenyl-3-methyl-5-hydroxy-6-metoxy-1,4-benzoquinol methylase
LVVSRSGAALQGSDASNVYGALDELHQLANAKAFNRWILDTLRIPVTAKRVVEIGAGIGTMTKLLTAAVPQSLVTSLEPSVDPFAELSTCHARGDLGDHVDIVNETSTVHIAEHTGAYDAAMHVNVLEHIENDLAELRTVAGLLRPGGTLHLFVPALPALYGPLDAKSGHYRRYRKKSLKALVEGAGFTIDRISYFDLLGAPAYFVLSKSGKATISGGDVEKFDKIWVSISRRFDRLFGSHLPFGKNLVVTARAA